MRRKSLFHQMLAIAVTLTVMFSTFSANTANAAAGQLTQFDVSGKVLKTKPARGSAIEPFIDAIFAYDSAVQSNGGTPPKDAVERLKRVQSLALAAKSEIRALAQNLSSNGEVADFNLFITEKVKKSGSAEAAREFQAAGGNAHAILLSADSQIDQEISKRAAAAKPVAILLLEHLFTVKNAEAGTGCSVFFFVVTLGYGTNVNYKLCGLR